MDDLDRLAFRLVRTVRNSYPHLVAQGFTLTDLEERLVPFRDARREMSNNGPEAWESTLLRMVSGERGYLATDADLQLACRQALRLASPTVALVRPWSATTVTLGHAALALGTAHAPTPARALADSSAYDNSAYATSAYASSALALSHPTQPLRLATPSAQGTVVPAPVEAATTPVVALRQCGCRFCGGKLPDSRKLTFCPHCGINLTVRQCPACSTELDVNWRFCVTCGRGSEVAEAGPGKDGKAGAGEAAGERVARIASAATP